MAETKLSDMEAAGIRRETAWLDNVRQMGDAASEGSLHLLALPEMIRPKVGMAFADATSPDRLVREDGIEKLRGIALHLGEAGFKADSSEAMSLSALHRIASQGAA